MYTRFWEKTCIESQLLETENIEKAVFAQIGTNKQTEPTIRLVVPVREAMQVSELKLEATMTSLKEISDNGFNTSPNMKFSLRPEQKFLEAPSQTGPASEIYETCSSQIWGQNCDLKTCYIICWKKSALSETEKHSKAVFAQMGTN